jgi:hypothetical protein
MKTNEFCTACPVRRGLCPNCGTFWVDDRGGKVFGVRPVDRNAWVAQGNDTRHPGWLRDWSNVIEREPQ